MATPMTTTNPVHLEQHIGKCIASLKAGAILDALYIGLFAILFIVAGLDITLAALGCIILYLLIFPFCQIWAKVLKRGIRLPRFTFWGNIAFVAVSYLLQFFIWLFVYIGVPFFMCAAALAAFQSLGSTAANIAPLAFLAWPIIEVAYICIQRRCLAQLRQQACSALQ